MKAYDRVKAIAEDKGITMKELCRRAGVQYEGVMNWKRKEPRQFETLRKLENVE